MDDCMLRSEADPTRADLGEDAHMSAERSVDVGSRVELVAARSGRGELPAHLYAHVARAVKTYGQRERARVVHAASTCHNMSHHTCSSVGAHR